MKKATASLILFAFVAANQSANGQCPALDPGDDGTAQSIGLIISEINPGDYIEVYNETGSDIDLAGTPFQFCSPLTYRSLSLLTGGSSVVPAKGYLTLNWPATFNDLDSGGEVILYSDSFFASATSVMDFVCWGINPHFSRKPLAEGAGKWTGGCAAALTNGALHRLVGTDGTSAGSYDVSTAPSPLDCAPIEIVPVIGEWGLCSMVLLVLVGGTVAIRRDVSGPLA